MNQIVNKGDKLYNLVRAINKDVFKTKDDVKIYMEYIHCDNTLQHQGKYLFVRNIDDVEFEKISDKEEVKEIVSKEEDETVSNESKEDSN